MQTCGRARVSAARAGVHLILVVYIKFDVLSLTVTSYHTYTQLILLYSAIRSAGKLCSDSHLDSTKRLEGVAKLSIARLGGCDVLQMQRGANRSSPARPNAVYLAYPTTPLAYSIDNQPSQRELTQIWPRKIRLI